jgi:hypothetical protein
VVLKRKEGSINNGLARYFGGTSFQIGPIWIGITGMQDSSGELTRHSIVIDLPRGTADLDVDRAGNPYRHERGIRALRSPWNLACRR